MNLLSALPYVYRAFEQKDEIEAVAPQLQNYAVIIRSLLTMVKNDADLWVKVESIIDHIFPDSGIAPKLPNMMWVQNALNAFGAKQSPSWHLDVDGKYGNHTGDAVADFQQSQGIEADRWFGMETYIVMLTWLKKNGITVSDTRSIA